MIRVFTRCLLAVSALVLFCAPRMLADSIVSMQLTGAGSNIDYGVHIGPYTATINGVSTLVICDDFSDATYIGETWKANVSTYPTLGSVEFDTGASHTAARTLAYNEVGWLAVQLMNSSNTAQIDAIQFAIWAVFNPSGVSNYLNSLSGGHSFDTNASNANGVQYWLNLAAGQTFTAGEFSNVTIYTPNTNYPMSCSNNRHESCPPQEFIAVSNPVKTPEPGTLPLVGSGLFTMLLAVKRRRNGAPNA